MKIKICGVTRAEDAKLSCELGAWAVGMIFAEMSPRKISLEQAEAVRSAVAPGVLAVGVFEGQPRTTIEQAIETLDLSAVQLHGAESPDDCRGFSVPVWKAFAAVPDFDKSIDLYPAAAIIVEPPRFPGDRKIGRRPSEEEQRNAWAALAKLKSRSPGSFLYIAAGGITPDNAAEAVLLSMADALDVSSGVELRPGVKDEALLRRLFEAVA
jgi:phosphoribosylanthranilate isomerase